MEEWRKGPPVLDSDSSCLVGHWSFVIGDSALDAGGLGARTSSSALHFRASAFSGEEESAVYLENL